MTAIEDARATARGALKFYDTHPNSPAGYLASALVTLLAESDRLTAAPTDDEREALGRRVREVWVEWAREQDDPKPSWLVPWDELGPADREVDMRIGEALAGFRRPGPITSDDPVPRYAQCDLWQALFGIDTSGEYEAFRAENSYADTWSWLLDKVRRRQGPITHDGCDYGEGLEEGIKIGRAEQPELPPRDEDAATSLAAFMESWYDRFAGPGENWTLTEMASGIVEEWLPARRQGPISDAQVKAAEAALSADVRYWLAEGAMRAALEAARDAS